MVWTVLWGEEIKYYCPIDTLLFVVEYFCRDCTGANKLGDALDILEKYVTILHPRLKSAFEQMYAYIN